MHVTLTPSFHPSPLPTTHTQTQTHTHTIKKVATNTMAAPPTKLVVLQARDGTLDDPVDAAILLPSDLLKSMLPEDCTY